MISIALGNLFWGRFMSMAAAASGKLDIGRVLGGTFKVAGRNIIPFAVLGLILAGLPTGVMTYFQAQAVASQASNIAAGSFPLNATYLTGAGVGFLVAMVSMSVLQGALIYATVQDMNGQRASIPDALTTGLRNFLPLIGLSIVATFGLGLGAILLIVPFFILACMWCVAGPALIVDRTGVMGAFGRSAQLTKGNRWRIFGLFVVVWLLLLVVGMVLGLASAASIYSTPGALENPAAAALSPLNIVINIVQQTITGVLFTTLFSVLYVELRRAKEGLGAEGLAEIFS